MTERATMTASLMDDQMEVALVVFLRSVAAPRWSLIAALLLALLATGCGTTFGTWGDESVWQWSGLENLQVRLIGELRFDETDTGVAWISEGGRLVIRDGGLMAGRQLTAWPAVDGSPVWEYEVDGDEREFDSEARQWLSEVVRKLVLRTSLGAEPRARRIYAERGVFGVLDEVDRLKSQSASAIYYRVVIEEAPLASDEAAEVARHASGKLSSSRRLSRTLQNLIDLHPLNDDLSLALLDGVSRISSSSQQRGVLVKFVNRRTVSAALGAPLASAVSGISSSSQQSAVLQALWSIETLPAPVVTETVSSVRDIDSSSRQQSALQALLGRDDLDIQHLKQVVDISRHISSTTRRANVLVGVLAAGGAAEVDSAVIEVTSGLGSSRSQGRVFSALLDRAELDDALLAETADSVRGISSSSTRCQILTKLVARPEDSESIWRAYLRSVASLGSSSDQTRLLLALLERPGLERSIVEETVQVAEREISSRRRREQVVARANELLANS